MAKNIPGDAITLESAAVLRGVSVSTISKMIARGHIAAYTHPEFGRTVVSRAEVNAYKPSVGGRPAQPKTDDVTTNRAAKKKAISRRKNEGGATPEGKKKGGRK